MSKQKMHILLSKAHKWVGLILGIQIFFWMLGGVVMSWLPINEVRGMHKVEHHDPQVLDLDNVVNLSEHVHAQEKPVQIAAYDSLLGRSIIRLRYIDGETTNYGILLKLNMNPENKDHVQWWLKNVRILVRSGLIDLQYAK